MDDYPTGGRRGRGDGRRGHTLCGCAGGTERRSHWAAVGVFDFPRLEAVNLLSVRCTLLFLRLEG